MVYYWPFFFSFLVPLVLMGAILLLSTSFFLERQKSSPFECGFDPKELARLPFSFRFFLMTVVFLIFDIELALVLPMPLGLGGNLGFVGLGGFFFILLAGVYYEWGEGSLDWMV